MDENKARELAKYEVGWWRAHHHRKYSDVLRNMADLYSKQFGIPYEMAKQAVELRVKAAKLHDMAEEFEDKGELEEAEKYWGEAENLLAKHFKVLPDIKK